MTPTAFSLSINGALNTKQKTETPVCPRKDQGLPAAPIGEVAGVMLWTLSPRPWEGAGAEAAMGGPGGFSLCGEVSGVVGWEVCPPASRARRLRRIYNARAQHSVTKQSRPVPLTENIISNSQNLAAINKRASRRDRSLERNTRHTGVPVGSQRLACFKADLQKD